MATITPTPITISDATLVIDTAGDSYEKAIVSAVFTPSSSTISGTAISPGAVYTEVTPATWTLVLTFFQDWDDADSLSNYLFSHEGESFPATFVPKVSGASIAATIIITPGSIGGDTSSFAQSTVTMGVDGKPVITP